MVKFTINDSVNDKSKPLDIIDDISNGKPLAISLQFKGKYAVSLGDSSRNNKYPVVYKMYSIEKNGKLKLLYTRKTKNGNDDAFFPEYRKTRYLLITSTTKGKTRNTFITFSPDLKYFEDFFAGLKIN